MVTLYIWLKFVHILIAILALGTSAGLGIVMEFYGDHPVHGVFVLRAIKKIIAFFVIPGYVLMLATGIWMMKLTWPVTAWLKAAMALWSAGFVLLVFSYVALRKQIRLFETEGPASGPYKRMSMLGRILGAAAGFIVIYILYLMVFKPGP